VIAKSVIQITFTNSIL